MKRMLKYTLLAAAMIAPTFAGAAQPQLARNFLGKWVNPESAGDTLTITPRTFNSCPFTKVVPADMTAAVDVSYHCPGDAPGAPLVHQILFARTALGHQFLITVDADVPGATDGVGFYKRVQ